MKILSLGWGVQSFTIAAMCALGELEMIDAAVHSDTTHEKSGTYEFSKKMTPWLKNHGVSVVTVKDEKASKRIFEGEMIPAYTIDEKGKIGQAFRTCTHRWKIVPVRRWLQKNREKQQVELWFGISTDESLRMRQSNVKYITNRYPLIEKGMSRYDCTEWLKYNSLQIPVSSSCVFCPYHSQSTWREIKNDTPEDFRKAVFIEEIIRNKRPPYKLFLNRKLIPLSEIDFRSQEDFGQLNLWDDECEGMCGL